jgi:hypothetical protein
MRNPLKPKPAKDIPDAILKGLRNGALCMLGLMLAYLSVSAILPDGVMGYQQPDDPRDNYTMSPVSPAEDLMEEHKCWTGEGPEGVIPGHAVITNQEGVTKYVKGDRGFAIWLEGAPGTLHGFCR